MTLHHKIKELEDDNLKRKRMTLRNALYLAWESGKNDVSYKEFKEWLEEMNMELEALIR